MSDPFTLRYLIVNAGNNPLNLDQQASAELDQLVQNAYINLSLQPQRIQEAFDNMKAFGGEIESRSQGHLVTVQDIQAALGRLCPLFPIC